jgi:hypothetical protein
MPKLSGFVVPQSLLAAALVLAVPWSGCARKAEPLGSRPAATAALSPARLAETGRQALEPAALDQLKRMSETLGAARSYTYKSRSWVETPARTGQLLTFFTEADVAVQRPNKLRAEVSGDVPAYRVTYDGARVALYDREKKTFAVTEAPGTIGETVKFLLEKFGIRFPSADVMGDDPYTVMARDLTSATVVGPSKVNGVATEHLAFKRSGINWEVWIGSGKTPLPHRLAATYTQEAGFPCFLVEFRDWNLQPGLPPGHFDVAKPANAREIEFGSRESPLAGQRGTAAGNRSVP